MKRTLYRSSSGLIFGVCKGLSQYSGISSSWIRLIFIIMIPLTAFVPVIVSYILMAIFIKPEPPMAFTNQVDEEFYNSYADNHHLGLQRLKDKFESLNKRTERIETIVTSKEWQWNQKYKNG